MVGHDLAFLGWCSILCMLRENLVTSRRTSLSVGLSDIFNHEQPGQALVFQAILLGKQHRLSLLYSHIAMTIRKP